MEFEEVMREEAEGLSDEDRLLSESIFAVIAPVVPLVMESLQKIDETITGGLLICWRPGDVSAIVTGNSPPSAMVPVLQKVLADMLGADREFIENAFAKTKAGSN